MQRFFLRVYRSLSLFEWFQGLVIGTLVPRSGPYGTSQSWNPNLERGKVCKVFVMSRDMTAASGGLEDAMETWYGRGDLLVCAVQ